MTRSMHSTSYALAAALLAVHAGAPANSQDQIILDAEPVDEPLSYEDRAYSPPATPEPELPSLPMTPLITAEGYPECREDYQKFAAPYDKAEEINRCTIKLDKYYAEVLTPFRQEMIDHQNELSALYTNEVAGKMAYSADTRNNFYKRIMREHAASDPEGANLAGYRALEARYKDDRTYLQDRFCFNTGCAGYAVPEYKTSGKKSATKEATPKTAEQLTAEQKCKKARGRGGLLGGIIGGVAGNVAGLGNVGTLISSGVGALLVSEIACQLTEDEQKEAAEATVAVTEKEEVGATASWKSPTRSGVSGSSTVTALNAQPNGRRCLSITDVAIIEGEETRVSKQMCRGQGDEGYVIVA